VDRIIDVFIFKEVRQIGHSRDTGPTRWETIIYFTCKSEEKELNFYVDEGLKKFARILKSKLRRYRDPELQIRVWFLNDAIFQGRRAPSMRLKMLHWWERKLMWRIYDRF